MSSPSTRWKHRLYRWLAYLRPAPLSVWIKRWLGIKRRVVSTPAGRFFVDPASSFGVHLLCENRYEPDVQAVLEHYLAGATSFVDLGANEGYFSVLASRLMDPSGVILAVEPQDRLKPVLERNLSLNDATNVFLEHCAVSDHTHRTVLHVSPDVNTGASGLSASTRYRLPTQPVDAVTLDALLDAHALDTVDLLKVDIEGYEHEALLGAPSVFQAHRVRTLVLELHPRQLRARGHAPREVLRFLARCGYTRDPRFDALVYTCQSDVAVSRFATSTSHRPASPDAPAPS